MKKSQKGATVVASALAAFVMTAPSASQALTANGSAAAPAQSERAASPAAVEAVKIKSDMVAQKKAAPIDQTFKEKPNFERAAKSKTKADNLKTRAKKSGDFVQSFPAKNMEPKTNPAMAPQKTR